MKKYMLLLFVTCCCIVGCNPEDHTKNAAAEPAATTNTVALPYTATYTTNFNNNVSDSDLLTVLNSYKYWEQGDMKALRLTMGDSMYTDMSNGFHFKGLADSVMPIWAKYRDSLSL